MSEDSQFINQLHKFFVESGRAYLASGGPTSRYEELVTELGEHFDLPTETYATSTGVFVSTQPNSTQPPVTSMTRVRRSSTQLNQLIDIEGIYEQVRTNQIVLSVACNRVIEIGNTDRKYSFLLFVSLFVMGLTASFPQFLSWPAAVLSGVVTILISWLSGPVAQKWRLGGIFGEFFASFLCLFLSSFLAYSLELSAKGIMIGGIVLLVPGIPLTNAISELAEQNLISGTSKLMRGLLTLLALGASYFLFLDIVHILGFSVPQQSLEFRPQMTSFYLNALFYLGLVFGFCNIFSVPLRHIPLALITGFASWFFLHILDLSQFIILKSFAPAFVVGFLSLIFSRLTKVPSQIYSVPGILALVPGVLALGGFSGATPQGSGTAYEVTVIVSGIVFGLLTARVPVILYGKLSAN